MTAAAACAAGQTRAGADEPVRVGLLSNFPPFQSWPEGGQPRGYDLDVLAELARSTGLRFEYQRFTDFPTLQAALRDGRVRVISATAHTPERATFMRFTRPYVAVQQGFAGSRELTSVPSTPDLAGRRLAVPKGYVSETVSQERFPLASRPAYPSLGEAIEAVARGEADFAFGALPTLRALLAERSSSDIAVLRTFGFPEGHLRLATGLPDAALARQLDEALGALPPAVHQGLRERWLPPNTARNAVAPAAGSGGAPLRVGYFPADRPYSLRSTDGRAEGIGIELIKAVAGRAGLEIATFEPLELPQGLAALSEGRIDIMLGLTDMAERRKRMSFVGPYRNNPLVIISRQQYSVWDLHQLAGRRLALLEGYFGAPYIRAAHPTIDIVACPKFDVCLDMVEHGQADAALYGLHGVYERLLPRSSRALQVTGVIGALFDEQNFGLSQARADLAPRLRDALETALTEDLPRIEHAWAEQESRARIDWQAVRQVALGAALLLLAVLAAWWWHSRSLRHEIARTQAARRESEQYLAFMAHEVRNSLQSVGGAVALLRGSSRPDARRQPLLEALGRTARSTLGLLNGLLDRHRLHEGRFELALRAESIERTVVAVADEMRSAAQAKGLQLLVDTRDAPAGWWQIDALRVQQILRNLLINAVKFSRSGTIALQVRANASARGDDWRRIAFDVVDEGSGMDEAGLARAFERFENTGGDRPGTGLGLHLCRDLALAMGGTLTVKSRPGAGSTFTLAFDARQETAPQPAAGGRLRRLLVVEDSPVYGMLLRQAFENQGVSTVLAESVAHAREALIASVAGAGATTPAFDLILSDTHLGDGHVADLVAFMRESVRPGVAMPPMLCMSAEFDAADHERLAATGAIDLLTKDSDVAGFATRVGHAFATHAQT